MVQLQTIPIILSGTKLKAFDSILFHFKAKETWLSSF